MKVICALALFFTLSRSTHAGMENVNDGNDLGPKRLIDSEPFGRKLIDKRRSDDSYPERFQGRIVGGESARAGEFPFMVSLYDSFSSDSYPRCGGSLISPNLVLTAAHCEGISGGVRVGSIKARGLYDSFPRGVEANVLATIKHPQYDGSILYDFMILVLQSDVDVNTYTPITLNFNSNQPNPDDMLSTLGFGALSYGGNRADTLMKVDVPANTHADCVSQYGNAIKENIHLCAGYAKGGKDSCQGDSGGPLFKEIDGVPTQVGIVSFGKGCAEPGYSGVYARVSGVSSWLKSEICNRSRKPKPLYCEEYEPILIPTLVPSIDKPTSKINRALHKPTKSSGFFGGYEDFKAVDGDYSSTYHSSSTLNQWWEVDLEDIIIVTQVKVINREDCCQDRLNGGIVFLKNSAGQEVYSTKIEDAPMQLVFDFPGGLEARYIMISHPTTYLNFADVEVYGESASAGLDNLVTGKPLTSSAYIPSFEPEKAVDNNEGTIFHSAGSGNAFWRVDFEIFAFVRQITIINRKDCCKSRLDGATVAIVSNSGIVVESVTISADRDTDVITCSFPDKPEGRFVRVYHSSEYLHFAEIMIYGRFLDDGLENIALLANATASSAVEGYEASNAIDGRIDTLFHSGQLSGDWFMIDLGFVSYIKRITIFNRQNCCQDRLNGAVLSIIDEEGHIIKSEKIASANSVLHFQFDNVNEARYVKIQNPYNILHFAELEVYGEIKTTELINLVLDKPITISNLRINRSKNQLSINFG